MTDRRIDRRSFLRLIGLGAGGAAAATVLPKIDLECQPKKGERFQLWANSEEVECLRCHRAFEITEDFYGIYEGLIDGEHSFLIENSLDCPFCRRVIKRFAATSMNFVEIK